MTRFVLCECALLDGLITMLQTCIPDEVVQHITSGQLSAVLLHNRQAIDTKAGFCAIWSDFYSHNKNNNCNSTDLG